MVEKTAVGSLVFATASAREDDSLRRVAEAGSVSDETRICIRRLEQALHDAGSSLSALLKVNCYLADDSDRAEFWRTWDAMFADINTTVVRLTQVVGLIGDSRVELDAVAVGPAR
jgi:2-iminobutanoate/2-iminopropanoate deaminase